MNLNLNTLKKFKVYGHIGYIGKFKGFLVNINDLSITHMLVEIKFGLFVKEIHITPAFFINHFELKNKKIYIEASGDELHKPYTEINSKRIKHLGEIATRRKDLSIHNNSACPKNDNCFVREKDIISTRRIIKYKCYGEEMIIGHIEDMILDFKQCKIIAFIFKKGLLRKSVLLDYSFLTYINKSKEIIHFAVNMYNFSSLTKSFCKDYHNMFKQKLDITISTKANIKQQDITNLIYNFKSREIELHTKHE